MLLPRQLSQSIVKVRTSLQLINSIFALLCYKLEHLLLSSVQRLRVGAMTGSMTVSRLPECGFVTWKMLYADWQCLHPPLVMVKIVPSN